MKQIPLFSRDPSALTFGGELLLNKRKSKRPLIIKKPIHLVLRADISQTGSMVRKERQIISMIDKLARASSVQVYQKAINSNHIHLVLKVNSREDYNSFVRTVSGCLAKAFKLKWLVRPFTRILQWGRDFTNVCRYVLKNELEAKGIIPYSLRRKNRGRLKPESG